MAAALNFDNPWLSLGIGLLSNPTLGQGLLSGVQLAQQSHANALQATIAQQQIDAENQQRQAYQQLPSMIAPSVPVDNNGPIHPQDALAMSLMATGEPSLVRQGMGMLSIANPAQPFTLAPGAVRFDAQGNQIAAAPDNLPSDVQAYNFAKGQGYPGTFTQFKTDIAKAGAANVNVGTTPGDAGRIAMMVQAQSDVQRAKALLFPNGKFDKTLALSATVPGTAGMPGNTAAREIFSALQNAISAKLRLETGQAATQSEVDNIAKRFMPTIFDTQESALDKLNRLDNFMSTALEHTKGYTPTSPKKQVVRTGTTKDGRKVIQYDDGSIEYAQ